MAEAADLKTLDGNDSELENSQKFQDDSDTETIVPKNTIKKTKYKYLKTSPAALKHITFNHKFSIQNPERYTADGIKYNMCFKMVKSDSRLIKSVLYAYGYIQCSRKNSNVNLIWSNTHMPGHVLRSLLPWQRLNHFPRSVSITKKDLLHQNLSILKKYLPDYYNFFPDSYILPDDNAIVEKKLLKNKTFPPMISKPAASSRGRGIQIITSTDEFKNIEANGKNKILLSSYITNPLLVNEKKFDIRLYVTVTSFQPLICYMFDEGLTRFATEVYDNDDKSYAEAYKHLTNYSLNKNSDKFIKNTDAEQEDVGHKWTLGALLRHLKAKGVDTKLLMIRMEDIVIKTLLSVQSAVAAGVRQTGLGTHVCFELFGFDILIDSDLKPWLLEVNLSPSLACDSPLDAILKTKVVCDTLNLAMIPYVQSKNILNTNACDDENTLEIPENDAVSSASVSSVPISRSTSPSLSASSRQKGYQKIRDTERPAPASYAQKIRTLANRVKNDKFKKGNFLRIFPRQDTYHLYKRILDEQDHLLDKLDRSLYTALFDEDPDKFDIDEADIIEVHKELQNCHEITKSEELSETSVRFLKEALDSALVYETEKHVDGQRLYPKVLPRLVKTARRRTASQTAADVAKREARLLALKEAFKTVDDNLTNSAVLSVI